jgi:hypothetical protein
MKLPFSSKAIALAARLFAQFLDGQYLLHPHLPVSEEPFAPPPFANAPPQMRRGITVCIPVSHFLSKRMKSFSLHFDYVSRVRSKASRLVLLQSPRGSFETCQKATSSVHSPLAL